MDKEKLVTYDPLNTLKKVAENIWIVDGEIIQMDFRVLQVPFTTRMTIIKLEDDSLWIHSPIVPNKKLFQEINALGEVGHLVSPNKLHYAYVHDWKTIYPEATAWASPGVLERANSQNIPVIFDRDLEDTAPLEWNNEISQLIFRGSRAVQEVVFFHHPSKTLILTDLIENFEKTKVNSSLWRTIHSIAGIQDPDGKMPIDYRASFIGKKDQARVSYQRMLAWQPEKVILAHGRWYQKNGTKELKRAFRWLE